MAEIEAIGDLIEGVEGDIEGEAADIGEEIGEEEAAELEAEVAEAQQATSTLSKVVDGLKKLGNLTWKFTKFIAETAATGAIFFGVTIALKKLMATSSGGDPAAQQKYKKIKAVSEFITSASELSKKVSDWLDAHKDDMITLDGLQIPLISIFVKYTNPLGDAATAELTVAKELRSKTADGKPTFLTPNAGQLTRVIGNGQALVDALRNFQAFAVDKSGEFPALKTIPMTKEDVDTLQQKLDAIKNMPF